MVAQTYAYKGLVRHNSSVYAVITDDEGCPFSMEYTVIIGALGIALKNWVEKSLACLSNPFFQAYANAYRSIAFLNYKFPDAAAQSLFDEKKLKGLKDIEWIKEAAFAFKSKLPPERRKDLLESAKIVEPVPEDFVAISEHVILAERNQCLGHIVLASNREGFFLKKEEYQRYKETPPEKAQLIYNVVKTLDFFFPLAPLFGGPLHNYNKHLQVIKGPATVK